MTLAAAVARVTEAVARLSEVDQRVRKRRSLARVERRLERDLGAAWRRQGADFVGRLARVRHRFSEAALREVIEPTDWEPLFTESELRTLAAFSEPLITAVRASLETGARHTIAQLGQGLTFALTDPEAVAYLERVGADRVTAINATTREQLRTLLTEARANGWSYNRTAQAIRAEFDGFSAARAQLVAVTETGDAYEAARRAVAGRLASAGLAMEKAWLSVGDARTDADCLLNQSAGWIPIHAAFPTGHDQPTAHPACLPGHVLVQARQVSATTERRYDGELVIIRTANGKHLTATPNHPVLTPTGWVPAGFLNEGSDVVTARLAERMPLDLDLDDYNVPARIEQVAEAFRRASHVSARPVPVAPEDFHGDGLGSEVAVVWTNGLLRDNAHATSPQHGGQMMLVAGDVARSQLAGLRHPFEFAGRLHAASSRFVSALRLAASSLWRHALPLQALSVTSAADLLTMEAQDAGDGGTSDAVSVREAVERVAGPVAVEQVVEVRRIPWSGQVYNLETASGWYIAEGIVVHNCRCSTMYRRVNDDS